MKKIILPGLLFLFFTSGAAANPTTYKISGRIVDAGTQAPIVGASVFLEGSFLWAASDQNGAFMLPGIQSGDHVLKVSFLGYVTSSTAISVRHDITGLTIGLAQNSLAIEETVVTAQAQGKDLNTSLYIGNNALQHLQISGVTDIAALLPGGKTRNPNLTSETASDHVLSLRSGGSTTGNASFGTAVEVNGVRVGNNASFGAMSGVDTRSIAVANIESVEVLTGVPSVEYGDLNSGMVRINTRKGYTPWDIQLSVSPRTWQGAFSKGFDLGDDRGALNISGEWTRATKKLISPYTSYSRRGLSGGYSNTFRRVLKFEAGVTGNLGGMNSEDDPDAYSGAYSKVRDNVLRGNTSLTWLLNRSWITNLKFDAFVDYNDNRSHERTFKSSGSEQPAVHTTQQGYFLADKLPYTYFSDKMIDSRELDYGASLKYEWNRRWGKVKSNLKAGVQWKATGNVGEGEYYQDPALAENGYRPRPYSDYPYMHNVSAYAEENLTVPVGQTTLQLMAGLRFESLFISGAQYDNLRSLSPRFNARWRLTKGFAVRGGWGVTEKLPSFYVLYPRQEYRDIQTFGFSYDNNRSYYVYHTQPYTLQYNENLKWQRNHNAELGVDLEFGDFKVMLVGYYNRTKLPYKYSTAYTPYSYNIMELPEGFTVPADPEIRVDHQTGMVFLRGETEDYWTPMEVKVTDRTFVPSDYADNGADVIRKGVEAIVDFPEIDPIRTRFRVDAAYGYTKYIDAGLSYYYNTGWSHTTLADRSYQYVGIYANGGSSSVTNGRRTHGLDANVTAITHIPSARIIITCRLEMSLLKRFQNFSEYDGNTYAFTVTQNSNDPTGGNIYDGNAYTAIYPVAYVDLDGTVRPFTAAEANDPNFASLIRKSNNIYTFASDGYGAYLSANLSVTKEIGDHVSLSLYANNFTNSRRYVTYYATGVSAVFTPDFYYGITCRIKF